MIIAGYSPSGPQIGVSSSLSALAAWNYFESNRSVLLVQIGFQNNLEETLLGMETWRRNEFFETKGIDELLRLSKAEQLDVSAVERAVVLLNQKEKNFALLPATTKRNSTLYEQKLKEFLPILMQEFNKIYDVIYLDFGWEQGWILKEVQSYIDSILLFFPQNRWILERYSKNMTYPENYRVILPSYQANSIWNFTNLKWRYPEIGKRLIGAIPWEISYMDEWSKGRGMEYLALQCDWKRRERTPIMDSVEKIWKKIQREVLIESRSEEKAI